MKGTVIKRGGKWSVVVDLGPDPTTRKRLRRWHSGYATKKEAERARVELLHQLVTGQYVEPTKETLGAFLERWLRDYVATNVAPARASGTPGSCARTSSRSSARSRLHTCAPRTSWLRSGTG